MTCSICNHPQRQKIDQTLVAGSSTLAALGQESRPQHLRPATPQGAPPGQNQPGPRPASG